MLVVKQETLVSMPADFLEKRDILRFADRVAMNDDVKGTFQRLPHLRTCWSTGQRQHGERRTSEPDLDCIAPR